MVPGGSRGEGGGRSFLASLSNYWSGPVGPFPRSENMPCVSRRGAEVSRSDLDLFGQTVRAACDPRLHHVASKIEYISKLISGRAQVGLSLFLVCRRDFFKGLQLCNNFALYDLVGSKAFIKMNAFIVEGNRHFAFYLEPHLLQLIGKRRLVNRF